MVNLGLASPSSTRIRVDGQEPICFEGGHAPHSGGCDRLAIYAVRDIARSENARDTGPRRSGCHLHISIGVQIDLALEQPSSGRVTDGDEYPIQINLIGRSVDCVPEKQTRNFGGSGIAEEGLDLAVPADRDLRIAEEAVL